MSTFKLLGSRVAAFAVLAGALGFLPGCKTPGEHRTAEPTAGLAGQNAGQKSCDNWKKDASLAVACSNPFRMTAHQPATEPRDARAGSKESECAYYIKARLCLSDCDESQRNRLLGYYQTCQGVTGLAAGDYRFAEGCAGNEEFTSYTEKMRYCLQEQSAMFNERDCHSCREVIDGSGGPFEGIIGSHTPCNATAGFCALSETSLRCFGAGLGFSWRGVLGSHSATGSVRSVGFCHLMAQAATCSSSGRQGYGGFMTFWRALCSGYQAGCEAAQGQTGTFTGTAIEGIVGAGSRTFDVASCKLSCPLPEDLNRVSGFGGLAAGYLFEKISAAAGRGGVLGAESACRDLVGTR